MAGVQLDPSQLAYQSYVQQQQRGQPGYGMPPQSGMPHQQPHQSWGRLSNHDTEGRRPILRADTLYLMLLTDTSCHQTYVPNTNTHNFARPLDMWRCVFLLSLSTSCCFWHRPPPPVALCWRLWFTQIANLPPRLTKHEVLDSSVVGFHSHFYQEDGRKPGDSFRSSARFSYCLVIDSLDFAFSLHYCTGK